MVSFPGHELVVTTNSRTSMVSLQTHGHDIIMKPRPSGEPLQLRGWSLRGLMARSDICHEATAAKDRRRWSSLHHQMAGHEAARIPFSLFSLIIIFFPFSFLLLRIFFHYKFHSFLC